MRKQIETHKIIGAQGLLLLSPSDPPNWPSISFGLLEAIYKLAAIEAEKCLLFPQQSALQSSDQKQSRPMGSSGYAAANGLSGCLVISELLQTLGCFVNRSVNMGEYRNSENEDDL